ncbi:YbaN family protein [Thermaurantiacus sp.]
MQAETRKPEVSLPPTPAPVRLAFLALGVSALVLGLVGVALPLLPTTPFLILAAAAFARSSPRLEGWLLAHPRLGPPLVAWRLNRAIPRPAKWASALGMAAGYAVFLSGTAAGPLPALGVALILVGVGIWIWRRPD